MPSAWTTCLRCWRILAWTVFDSPHTFQKMKRILTGSLFLLLAVVTSVQGWTQCTADYDFGAATLGVSPDPDLGESFAPGVIGENYEDILHILLPEFVLDIDPTLPFLPTTPLDSASLSSVVRIAIGFLSIF